jgi:hypothetical protein
MRWYRDRQAWSFIGRYVMYLAGLNLLWEIAQLPLYTIWNEASPGDIAFAVAHCTAGDLLIGTAALAIALTFIRAGSFTAWRWPPIAVSTAVTGVLYTALSEWTNTTLFRWAYSELMPTINLGAADIGLSPLLQWLVVPTLSLYLAKKTTAVRHRGISRGPSRV